MVELGSSILINGCLGRLGCRRSRRNRHTCLAPSSAAQSATTIYPPLKLSHWRSFIATLRVETCDGINSVVVSRGRIWGAVWRLVATVKEICQASPPLSFLCVHLKCYMATVYKILLRG